MVLVPKDSFLDEAWQPVLPRVWDLIASAFGCSRVARSAEIDSGGTRASRLELVLDAESRGGVVLVVQNGVKYEFDATKCMFSSGNITEKQRVAKFPAQGEVVVDLFCGIGYFTLPLLVHAGVTHVHACDWNPHAVAAIRHNLKLNGVEGRCTVHEGDNRVTTAGLDNVANRVLLGLIPSSQGSWHTAVRVLSQQGGWLHVHENVHRDEVTAFVERMEANLADIARGLGKVWNVSCKHVERVKSYAPRVYHYVFDVLCAPLPPV